jgi:hypothetical protein
VVRRWRLRQTSGYRSFFLSLSILGTDNVLLSFTIERVSAPFVLVSEIMHAVDARQPGNERIYRCYQEKVVG